MSGLTKFSALAVTGLLTVAALVVALAWLGPPKEEVSASASVSLFDQDLVQEIYRRVSPAVVVVRADRRSGDSFTPASIGSGFLVDRDGHIATNNHVIQGADRVVVEFQGGFAVPALVLGTSPGNDLALLRVHPASVADIEPVHLGDSSLVRPGQLAVAIGSPLGLGGSVTVGVVGGIDRVLGSDVGRPIHGILQTDATTNPGDSGGPLLDRTGRVVGINTSVQVGPLEGDAQNAGSRIGFASPVDTLTRLLPELKKEQVIRPTLLGIAAAPVTALLAERLGLNVISGIYLTRVLADSPAGRAALVPAGNGRRSLPVGGDIIIGVDAVPVASTAAFFAELDGHLPGEKVVLSLVRQGVELEIPVTLDEWPEGGNPFTTSADVNPSAPVGYEESQYPFIPKLPGFSFPSLFPASNPGRGR